MDDAVLNAACEKVAKVAGSTGLGYLEVALGRKKIEVCYTSPWLLLQPKQNEKLHIIPSSKNIFAYYSIRRHSVTFSKSKFTLDTQSSN